MATHRTKSISTKVTEAEYARVAAIASPLTISEWTRSVLMHALDVDSFEVTFLADIEAESLRHLVRGGAFERVHHRAPGIVGLLHSCRAMPGH